MNPIESLLVHRGFSHSIVFCILASPMLGWLVYKIHSRQNASWKDWSWLFFWGLFTHPLLDAFTTWGTQLFWPLESRLAYKSIFVIDPLYTFPFMIFLILAMTRRKDSFIRRRLNYLGLIVSTLYLSLTFINKLGITQIFQSSLAKQEISYSRMETKPMPLQNLLWTANVEIDSGYLIGYYSRLDNDQNIKFHFYERNSELWPSVNSEQLSKAKQMTKGWYALEKNEDTLVIHDLRFGIVGDLNTGEGEFVFDYLAKPEESNGRIEYYIEQKRNSFEWADTVMNNLLRRIAEIKE